MRFNLTEQLKIVFTSYYVKIGLKIFQLSQLFLTHLILPIFKLKKVTKEFWEPLLFSHKGASSLDLIFSTCMRLLIATHLVQSWLTFTCLCFQQGNNYSICLSNGSWSYHSPTCICPPCTVGKLCEYSTSFQKTESKILNRMVSYVRVQIIHVAAELNRYMLYIEPNVLFNVLFLQGTFAGHQITCKTRRHSINLLKYDCTCVDEETRSSKKCTSYFKKSTACRHALSALFKRMMESGIYPMPCDPEKLASGC